MKLVVGLGNPGKKYEKTRHNVGFLVVDALAAHELTGVKFLKPDTFMNLSGQAVAEAIRQSNMGPSDILVIYDDADIPFGNIRFRSGGSSGGHNGMKSILALFPAGVEIARVRVGIGRSEHPNIPLDDHVLGNWSAEEKKRLPEVIAAAADRAVQWVNA